MKELLAVVVLCAAGCHSQTTASTVAHPVEPDVRVSLVEQSCHHGDDLRDLVVKVRIDNPTASTLHIDEDSVRLRVGELTTAVRDPRIIDVPARSNVTIAIGFRHHSVCEPEQRFAVSWNDALVIDGHPIDVANLTFHE